MLIQRMAASFGRLQNDTLELQPGLNILQAPNETGKSTWCAFLLSMLYGINSRERDRPGAPADKNRYAPWSGALMAGRVDCRWNGRDITLLRATRRQGTPMGEFKALYTGTADIVPDLTGQTCGETLLGVTREVYERSAFIRQSGLAVSRDAELERRIAALLTSGEEDVSFSEAAAALKKQLNRRRHNKTGQIPALEAQLAELAAALEQSDGLAVQLERSRREAETLEQRVRSLTEELEAWDRWENAQRSQSLDKLRQEADTARAQADALRAQLEQERIPGSDVIARLRGAIVNLETTRKALHKAREERDEAMKAVLRAEDAVSKSPFAGQTPEQVQRQLETPPQGRPSYTGAAALGIAGAAAGALTGWGLRTRGTALSLGLAAAVLFFTAFGVFFLVRSQKRKARLAALNRRYGTADADQIARMAEEYSALCRGRDEAQEDLRAKSAAADALYATLSSNEQGILLEVRRFASAAFDIPTADLLLRRCAQRRKELAEAESAAREASLRVEALTQSGGRPQTAGSAARPARSREAISQELAQAKDASAAARSTADHLAGQLHAAGDRVVLQSQIRTLTDRRDALETEYAALTEALEALEQAGGELQGRFSPALGRRAAEIFRALTGGRYTGVVLDRDFRVCAQPEGDQIYRDAPFLSAGTVDQLYLAVRLAVCDLALPREDAAPLILDDALTAFDDERCAAALTYLKEEAKNRQILLFTCHSREAEFFAGDSEVSVQRLTASPRQV